MVKRLEAGEKVSFTQHLEELRKRLIIVMLTLAIAFIGCYYISDKLLAPFAKLLGSKMVFLAPLDAIMAYMSIAFYAAMAVTVPMTAYQIYAFVSPGLEEKEKRGAVPIVLAASVLFATGVTFCWFTVLPLTVKFLIGYGGDLMTPMISVKAYMSFCLSMLFVFGVVFELPLAVVIVHAVGLVSYESLKKFRRYWVVVAFILGAVVSPSPDVVSQSLAAVPLVVLYELSIVYIYFFARKKETEPERDDAR
ncbi:MAG: twin-arginine translocase subunit TatC [Nitrospinae bacterium]|nr:twin-arginine translocase subunit TatC [Nitrospinota bacterium]